MALVMEFFFSTRLKVMVMTPLAMSVNMSVMLFPQVNGPVLRAQSPIGPGSRTSGRPQKSRGAKDAALNGRFGRDRQRIPDERLAAQAQQRLRIEAGLGEHGRAHQGRVLIGKFGLN